MLQALKTVLLAIHHQCQFLVPGPVTMFTRVALFLATNFAILVLVSLVFKVFGLDLQAARYGTDLGGLLVMCAVFGFAGSFISLAISKWMAKRATGMTVITQPRNEPEQWLINTVQKQADKAGIKMPEVGIYEAPEINAFATGMSRNSSLVAVSSGLLRSMTRDEAEAVLNGNEGMEALKEAGELSRRYNVEGVPFFIVNGQITLSGAQWSDAFLAAFEQASDPKQIAASGFGDLALGV